ncbi:hypothetical protein MKY41_07485 [Sporosarcina sp. FSL W7-1349]|uniref:hypothetical protein n=1 Tax=Sporosarcina sp. FSL W7-1349 TaxID=2921561 RepID=UPI0030F4EFDB
MLTTKEAAITWDDIEAGYELPVHEREVTAALVAGGAISATHDYATVHHDYHAARKAGAEDIFMNILTTNGLIGKYITDWTGPTGELKKIQLRLAVPNYPGDRFVISGTVTKKYEANGEYLVEIDYKGKNKQGDHASGSVIVSLPKGR